MKAQEYFDKYFADKKYADVSVVDSIKEMYRDFMREYEVIKNQRGVKTMNGAVGVIRELNEKWNSVEAKVEKKFGKKILKRNVIWNTVLSIGWADVYPRKPE